MLIVASLLRGSLLNRLSWAKILLEIPGDFGFLAEEAPQRRTSNRWDLVFKFQDACFIVQTRFFC